MQSSLSLTVVGCVLMRAVTMTAVNREGDESFVASREVCFLVK